MIRGFAVLVAVTLVLSGTKSASAFAYIFAGETNGLDVVSHPQGYVGTGGTLVVTVGINPSTTNANQMVVSAQNVVRTINRKVATTGNLEFVSLSGQVDFESTLLHEVGHSLGLAHVNAATESQLPSSQRNYTKATNGANNNFDLSAGADGVIGSADDIRGDDDNLNWFKTADNNPFTLASVVDSTTYSRDLADLPTGDLFSTNGDRTVADQLFSLSNTEAVMQQGQFSNELQRTLTADDVAGIRYGESGLDEIAGTADDYVLELRYAGITTNADIVINDSTGGFAFSRNSGQFISGGPGHIRMINQGVFFDPGANWHFNQQSNAVPEPSAALLLLASCSILAVRRRRTG